jgi:hypothetical protein
MIRRSSSPEARGHDDLADLAVEHDGRQVAAATSHLDAVDALPVLRRIVVHERHRLQAQGAVAQHLACEAGSGVAGAVD